MRTTMAATSFRPLGIRPITGLSRILSEVCMPVFCATMACGGGVNAPMNDSAAMANAVTVALFAPASAPSGGVISVRLRLANSSREPVRLELAGWPERPYIGLLITRPAGDSVATIFNATAMLRIAFLQELAREQFVDFPADFTLRDAEGRPVPPGSYLVRARLLGASKDVFSDTKTLTVQP